VNRLNKRRTVERVCAAEGENLRRKNIGVEGVLQEILRWRNGGHAPGLADFTTPHVE
jgi:hypothetical protein